MSSKYVVAVTHKSKADWLTTRQVRTNQFTVEAKSEQEAHQIAWEKVTEIDPFYWYRIASIATKV